MYLEKICIEMIIMISLIFIDSSRVDCSCIILTFLAFFFNECQVTLLSYWSRPQFHFSRVARR